MDREALISTLELANLKNVKSQMILQSLKEDVAEGDDGIDVTYSFKNLTNNHNFVFNYNTKHIVSLNLSGSLELSATEITGLPENLFLEFNDAFEEFRKAIQA